MFEYALEITHDLLSIPLFVFQDLYKRVWKTRCFRLWTSMEQLEQGLLRILHWNVADDIGEIINATNSENEVIEAVEYMTSMQKYLFITQHYRPPQTFSFPLIFKQGPEEDLISSGSMITAKHLIARFAYTVYCSPQKKLGVSPSWRRM